MERRRFIILFSSLVLFLVSAFLFCAKNEGEKEKQGPIETDLLTAEYETEPVSASQNDDAADDPAIWIDFDDPSKSLIVGTNKKAGLNLYTLDGKEVFFIAEGLINNVDLRYDFDLNGRKVDISGGSNRTNNSICFHIIDGEARELIPVHARNIISNVDEVYGFCMYRSKQTGDYYAFVNGKNGTIEQWKLFATEEDKIDAEIVRTLEVSSQPEGMVADDEKGILYVGEEMRGVWKFMAEPDAGDKKEFIANSGRENPDISFDVEGLSIFYMPEGKGYLIASSQGNNSFAIFERENDNEYLTSFSISDGKVDGVEETDGLDVSNYAFNDDFPGGLLVVQDGFNFDGDSLSSQNFKLVDWRKAAYLIDPEMKIDVGYNPYN
jgi:3-phytase